MSSGPRTQAPFIQGNQSAVEQDASHSALFYLFQEVSRLASPVHNTFLETNSPSKWLNEAPRQDRYVIKKEEDEAHSFQTFNGPCQRGLSGVLPCDQMSGAKDEGLSGKAATVIEPQRECNSPWKVLSLINLQCERLLHPGDAEESDVTKRGAGSGGAGVEYTARPSLLIYKRQEVTASVSHVEDARGDRSGGAGDCTPQRCVRDSKMVCSVRPQAAEKTETGAPELVGENATASSQPQHGDQSEVRFSGSRQSEWHRECKEDCSSTQPEFWNVAFSENALPQARIPSASLHTQLALNSNGGTSAALSKSALTLDHNANIALTAEPPLDAQLPPASAVLPSSPPASLFCGAAERCRSLPKNDNRITGSKPECTRDTAERSPAPADQLKTSSYNVPSATLKPELRPVREEDAAPPSSHHWRTKTPRKQPRPSRSVDIRDPDLQGVTFRMGTELDDSREQCRLLITSKYSRELCKGARRLRPRARTSQKSLKTSSSDEESDLTAAASKGKVCASCCTRKTPMWRDAEDGTPLCNACGIRYKKYRVRCVNCWHIPRKEGNSNSCCLKCGNLVRLTSAQRKHTT